MGAEPKTRKDFWSFIIKGTRTEGSTAFVTGWFVICRIESPDKDAVIPPAADQVFHFDYLTPLNDPVELDVSSFMPPRTTVETISAGRIMQSLERLFGLPFQGVPKAPVTVPLHRMPPSRRRKLEQAQARRGHLPTRQQP